MAIGFDVGTYNLVCSKRTAEGDFDCKRQVNAFLAISLENEYVYNMMNMVKVPLIKRSDIGVAYAVGEAAVNMAYTLNQLELKRPMKDGCVNPKEHDAFHIMSTIIHSLIGEVDHDQEKLVYCVPANAINQETDADYHKKICEAIFKAYKSEKGYTVDPKPINEGLALIYAELKDKMFTGIGCSLGAGMVNVSFAMFGVPVFSFAIVNSGDWIDKQAANATGESIAFINKAKTKIDLTKEPANNIERAIKTQYELMIEKTVAGIKKGLEENKGNVARVDGAVDFVVAGGTSSPPGFDTLFEKSLKDAKLSIEIGNVIRPADPIYSVAKGCLICAENIQ